MSHSVNTPDIFRWKRFTKRGIPSKSKVQLTDGDINQWMKRVEMASEFAISEVFSPQKTHTGKTRRVVPLQNAEQLQDHDDAYSEAQAVLSDWMNRKLLHELEMDEEGEELICSNEMQTPELIALNQSANLNYKNFDDMYSHLAQEDESFVVHNFLQDLMETEVLDSGISEDLCLDLEKEKKRGRDPGVTMELRHRQVKENRVRREAAQERQRREAEVRREAREQARRLEWAKQRRKQQEARKQEELLQQEVIRLRREMQGKRRTEQLARKMERERLEELHCSQQPVTSLTGCGAQRRLCCREQQVEAKVHILHLQCMQKHFSGWYSVVLEKRVRLGKAAALCDWRRQLRVWRAWRALVWAKRMEREAERTEEELRMETRRCQVAVESDWRRLMRRCLNDWRLWCRMEKERRELLSQQEETKRKMADLISAAASGKLAAESCTEPPITALHNACNQSDEITRLAQGPVQRASLAHTTSTLTDRKAAPPTQAWQVTRRHAALSPEDLHQARHGPHLNAVPRCWSAEVRGGRFEHRHAVQKQTIAEQRHLLREQQELISHLQETQNFLELRQEAERSAEAAAALSPVHVKHAASRSGTQANAKGRDANTRSKGVSSEESSALVGPKTTVIHPVALHPAVRAMEERALLRAERRREVEDMKRRREEERQAQMKAAEEERQRQEEKEKRLAAERRKDERRQQRERELEKQKRAETEQQLLKRAVEHYHRSLLLHRGLAPWKRLVAGSQTRMQKAVDHYQWGLQRRCLLSWLQVAGEALADKEAHSDQLYKHILLRRAVWAWKRMKRQQTLLGEQAEHFFRARVQRKAFNALLDHATHERLVAWENTQQAAEHSARQLLRRCFGGWRHLPMVLREEREREARRQRLRRMVAEVLPDFRSSRVDGLWSSAPRL
ncbi:coiled-coil domain-containing protein 191 [Electrophorus electricus]|uniref:coiled-coil domain-containing protein 191 n=1 Tax=Electrophorus electricus TaxID=8005 RepID=UPI0015D06C44|nr:coiled-coil domain-containing protein 191 [Electrophorus electricus]